MDRLKKFLDLPLLLLIIGCVFIFLPSFFPEFKVLYVLGAWLGPFFILYYSRQSGDRFRKAVFFPLLSIAIGVRFCSDIAFLALGVLGSFLFYIPYMVDRYFSTKDAPFIFTLLFPAVYSVIDLIFMAGGILPIGSLAYAQYDDRPLLQVVSVIGENGLTFFICLVVSIAVYVVTHWKMAKAKRIGAALLLCVAAVHAWGFYVISGESDSPTIRLAESVGPMLSKDANGDWVNLPYETNLKSFNKIAETAHDQKAEMLFFNEEAFAISDSNEADFVANAVETAKRYKMPILLPMAVDFTDSLRKGRYKNVAMLIDDEGNVRSVYNKRYPVPIMETSEIDRGTDDIPSVPLKIGGKTYLVSFAICFDGNFTGFIRTMNDSTQIYLNPSWDWDAVNDFHYRSIAMRAVENGVNLVMLTYDGVSVVSNEYGKELFRKGIKDVGYEKVFITDVPTSAHATIYGKYGNYINGNSPFIAILLIGYGIYRKRRKKSKESC